MGTELKIIEEDKNSNEVFVTKYFGGLTTGFCLQVTQKRQAGQCSGLFGYVTVTRQQAEELRHRLNDFLGV